MLMTEKDTTTQTNAPGLDLDMVQEMGDQRVVLVVEDDPDTLNLLKLTLRRAGMNVVGATDGKQAIRKWMDINPNIVLLDLMMPEMDGWETLSQLRAVTEAPIIILSALSQKENVVRGLNLLSHLLDKGDDHSATFVVFALRAELGRIAERFDNPDGHAARIVLVGLSDRVRAIRDALDAGDRAAARAALDAVRREAPRVAATLTAAEPRSYYNPDVLAEALAP